MLQPKSYPTMIGKALMLEADPFITMVDDDNPWVEGLFMLIVVGVSVGVARLVGGLLLTLTLPPPNAVLAALLQGWRQLSAEYALDAVAAEGEAILQQGWNAYTWLLGYGGGWARLLVLVAVPMLLIVIWLLYGLVGHGLARLMGGSGTLNQTLGAVALICAPQVLLLITALPFVSVGVLLLDVWSLLIAYRALHVAHELPWHKAMWAALLPPLLLMAGLLLLGGLISMAVTIGGL